METSEQNFESIETNPELAEEGLIIESSNQEVSEESYEQITSEETAEVND